VAVRSKSSRWCRGNSSRPSSTLSIRWVQSRCLTSYTICVFLKGYNCDCARQPLIYLRQYITLHQPPSPSSSLAPKTEYGISGASTARISREDSLSDNHQSQQCKPAQGLTMQTIRARLRMRIRSLQSLIPNIHENPPRSPSLLPSLHLRNLLLPKGVMHSKQIPIPPFPKRPPLLVRHC